ncbi:hypothetical protein F5890DRAFT_1540243 [Lentinula detonsa]|uniref:Uncharacterized protein n=1 Tax=Lentinula detonsa TaxID=2804962 RepID=A0AA38UPI8_9AGAR|nr:hypothetical protein F5890DRAFT_1540243 [Lentinula detonsa]
MQNVLKSSPSFQRPKTCSIQLVSSSSKRGAELLNNWVQDEGASSFDAHLQDVFDIINHLQSHHQVADLEKFLLWTHRRAFRKLGSWVKEFSERWGNTSPFVIMEDCLDAILECSPRWTHCFDISLESIEYEVVKVFVDEDQLTNMEPGRYKYRVDSSNIQKWIALFKYLLEHLEMALLHSAAKPHVAIAQRKLPSTPPNEISTQIVTLRVACLHALRRVFRHLFSLPVPKFHQALAEAGMLLSISGKTPSDGS